MKKITILSLTMGYGGIEKYISQLCWMLYKNYEIEIISTFKTTDKPAFTLPKKVKIKYLINDSLRTISIKTAIKQFKLITIAKEIIKRKHLEKKAKILNIKEIKKCCSDIIITTRNYHHDLVSRYIKNKKILLIATEHNYHQNNKKYINVLCSSMKKFNYLIVPTKQLYNDYKNIIGNCKCVTIPIPINDLIVDKSSLKNKNIISVGRFSEEKGFLDLIDIFKMVHDKLPKIKLYLIGDGYQKNEIKSYINNNNLNDFVIMPGFLDLSQQKKYYLDSSLYVMTSYTEAYGIVLIESMKYGVPCIAFDCASGPRELINKDIGILIKSRNKKKMANKIIELMSDKSKLKIYQKNIENYIKTFDYEKIRDKYLEILK